MALNHNTLENYYKTNALLKQRHNFLIDEIENLIPFERDVYISIYNGMEKEKSQATIGDGGYSQMLTN